MTDKPKLGEATVESEESDVENTQPTLLGAVLADMGKAPEKEEQLELKPTPTSETEEEETTSSATPPAEGEDAKPEEESQSEETEEEAEKPEEVAAETEEEEAVQAREEWPEDAKARVAAETAKRRKRTEERDKALNAYNQALTAAQQWQAQAQQLNVQLQQKKITPTARDPLADVLDVQQLEEARRQYDELLAFAERGLADPDKAQNILLGATATGEEIRESYTPAQLVDMKLNAQRVKELIPAKYNLFQRTAAANAEALRLYPQLQTDPEWNQRATIMLQQMPELRRQPDHLLWIGHALAGEKMLVQRNGNGAQKKTLSEVAEKLKNQPKFKTAPGIAKSRSPVANEATSSSRIEAAKKAMKENPSDESLEAYIAATLGGPNPQHEKALV